MVGEGDDGSELMDIGETIGTGLSKDGLLILESDSGVLRLVGASWIGMKLSVVIESEHHGLEVIAVYIPLHNRISRRLNFPLDEIPVALDISLELIAIVLGVLHDGERSVGILMNSDGFKQVDLVGGE